MAKLMLLLETVCLLLVSLELRGASAGFTSGQLIVGGGGEVGVPGKCNNDINGRVVLKPKCNPNFMKYCSRFPGRVSNDAFFPNCVGNTREEDANTLFQLYAPLLDNLLQNTSANSVIVNQCLELLLPFMCTTLYPLSVNISGSANRLAPCLEFCNSTFSICAEAGLPVDSVIVTCEEMFVKNCPAREDDMLGLTCISPIAVAKPEPSSCFKECNLSDIAKCTGQTLKPTCKTPSKVRTTISNKKFPNFKFGKHD